MQDLLTDRQHQDPVAAARTVLADYWDGSLPVDPGEIARAMGVRVEGMGSADEPAAFSGFFTRRDPLHGWPVIKYSRTDSSVRRRFTVAHELGHFVLGHGDRPRDDAKSFGVNVTDPQERAANRFAAELLMPAAALRRLVGTATLSSIEELAQAFAVSKVAMGYRLSNLQLVAA